MLVDNHDRKIDYLRLAVTDRCNLRCHYCMPEEGINFKPRNEILSIDELAKVTETLVDMGIRKVRITGGEPFARKDLMVLLRKLTTFEALDEISITTNATLIGPHINELKALGITQINVSLDAVAPERFKQITRRDQFTVVYENLMQMIAEGFQVKVNCIVLDEHNTDQLLPMLETLVKHHDVSVRFLEEMPFNGGSKDFNSIQWDHKRIYTHIAEHYSEIEKLSAPITSTSLNYKIKGYKGSFGIIPSFTRSFCGSCNRLRINANGDVITCLYAKAFNNIRAAVRNEALSKDMLQAQIQAAISQRAKNGYEAEAAHKDLFKSSMTSIGG